MRTWETTAGGDLRVKRGALVVLEGAPAVGRTVTKCLRDVQGENWIDARRGVRWTRESRGEVLAARAKLTALSVEGVSSVTGVDMRQVGQTLTIGVKFVTVYSPSELVTVVGA